MIRGYYDHVVSWDSRKRWERRLPFLGLRRDIRDQNSLFWGIELNGKTYQVQDIDIDSNVRYGKVRAIERETGKSLVIAWRGKRFWKIYRNRMRTEEKKREIEEWERLIDTAGDPIDFEEIWKGFGGKYLSKKEARKIWEEKIIELYIDGLKSDIHAGLEDWEEIRKNNFDWDIIQEGLRLAGVEITSKEAKKIADEIWEWYEGIEDK